MLGLGPATPWLLVIREVGRLILWSLSTVLAVDERVTFDKEVNVGGGDEVDDMTGVWSLGWKESMMERGGGGGGGGGVGGNGLMAWINGR